MHARTLLRAWPLMPCAALLLLASTAIANHGPGTSGGASATISGETLRQGRFELTLREDYTKFEEVSAAEAERRATEAGSFDALEDSHLITGGIGFGVTDDLTLSATIGYYIGGEFIDAHVHGDGSAGAHFTEPEGITDLTLSAKYRLLRGRPGNLSAIAGIIIPTGKDDVRLDNGELLEPSSQPGTGAFAYQLGLAWSRFLTPRVTADASALYTIRTPHDGFEVGDRLDLGVAVGYRLTPSIQTFPNYSVFSEVNAVWLGKDEEGGEANPNSGGWTLYLTPGFRVRLTENIALTVAPSVPFLQDLNGDQVETRFKVAVAVSFTF